MATAFKSETHQRVFGSVLSELRGLGYKGELLQQGYSFADWFVSGQPQRTVPAAAFGRTPLAYDSACFAVLVPNGQSGAALVAEHRALGAPFALEVHEDRVTFWQVGRDEKSTKAGPTLTPDRVTQTFKAHAEDWKAQAVLRAKNIPETAGARQIDFLDFGLIPALEEQVREKLDEVLKEVLSKTKRAYKRASGSDPDEKELFRLVFRLLAAKVLHDREVSEFASFTSGTAPASVLHAVGRFYGQHEPVLDQPRAQETAFGLLWDRVNFQNLSVEALAYIYENTLVSESSRRKLGTHSTPSSVARYLAHRLPFEGCRQEERVVVEPCSGHCILLVAAMQRLRELLPATMGPEKRHQYLVRMLRGFELDAFAVEVGKLCLMLADFPNANGWQLENKDVFSSRRFTESLGEARFVLCNPPFEDFSDEDRERYRGLRSVHRPAALLHRVLEHLHPEGSLGFVLPRHFVDGKGYRELREELARRFQELEVVALPDRIFHVSTTESALLVARSPGRKGERVSVSFAEVADRDRERFLLDHHVTAQDVRRRSEAEVSDSLVIPPLWGVWRHLTDCPTLETAADLHRGIEWEEFDESACYSTSPRDGFKKGFTKVRGDLFAYLPIQPEYLNVEPANLRRNAILLDWGKPKVVLNAARISRGPWRLAAFTDTEKNLCSQRFVAIWPRTEAFTAPLIAAVLNGPVANAFVTTRERGRDNHIRTLKTIPLPTLSEDARGRITRLVAEYQQAAHAAPLSAAPDEQHLRNLLLELDALVLAGYNLPPRLERKVLSFFEGERRPVPFPFDRYDVERFALLRAVGGDGDAQARWEEKRKRRTYLAQRLLDGQLTVEEDQELAEIDRHLDRYVDTVSPLPFDMLEALKREARLAGAESAIDE